MPAPLALAFAGLMLAGTPGSGATEPPPSGAESFSLAAGHALGAAAACDHIADQRIDSDADRLGDAIDRLARNAAERVAAHRLLSRGVTEGGDAVERGATDCAKAEQALVAIEQRLPQ